MSHICKTVTFVLLAASAAVFGEARADDIVVIVSAKSTANTMTPDDISKIYLGKSNAMKPIDNGDKSAVRSQFYSKVAGKDSAQVKAIWSKLVFTGKATAPRELETNSDVVKAVAADPGAIGYIEKSAVDARVKVVLEVK